MDNRIIAIVPSAGIGKRFHTSKKKTFINLNGTPLFVHTLKKLHDSPLIREIIPVLRQEDIEDGYNMAKQYDLVKIRRIAPGGPERQDSIYNALRLLEDEESDINPENLVLVHDGVRPFIPEGIIERLAEELEGVDCVIPGVPVKDTIKEIDSNSIVVSTLNREKIRAVQTPQIFSFRVIKNAYDKAFLDGIYATDDAALVERTGGKVKIISGSPLNIKVTTPEDLEIVKYILRKEQRET